MKASPTFSKPLNRFPSTSTSPRLRSEVISEASVRQSFAHFGNIIEVKMMVGAFHGKSWEH